MQAGQEWYLIIKKVYKIISTIFANDSEYKIRHYAGYSISSTI